MGSPVSPIVANIYMEWFEVRAIASAPTPPHVWYRYVDDTFVVIQEDAIQDFTNHINSIDPFIKFTTEPEVDNKLPFLDTQINLQDDSSIQVSIYRKPTHTDQYLNFNSNHHLEHKRSVVRTLLNRADTLVTTPSEQNKEKTHVRTVLKSNGYPGWIFKTPREKNTQAKDTEQPTRHIRSVGLPYIGGLSEKLTNIFRQYGVPTYHKPFNTIRSLLVHPKDKTPAAKKCGVIYNVKCPECNETYVGESARSLETRMGDHKKNYGPLTAVAEHRLHHHHTIETKDADVIGREEVWGKRKILESIEIRERRPQMNRDQGYDLPAIYNRLLSRVTSTRDSEV
jgi:hypothetical protein